MPFFFLGGGVVCHHNRVIPSWKHLCVNFISPLLTASVSSPHPGVLCLTKTIKIPLNLGKEPLGAEIKWSAACSLSCCTDKWEFAEIKRKTLSLEEKYFSPQRSWWTSPLWASHRFQVHWWRQIELLVWTGLFLFFFGRFSIYQDFLICAVKLSVLCAYNWTIRLRWCSDSEPLITCIQGDTGQAVNSELLHEVNMCCSV